jgi:elongation factor P
VTQLDMRRISDGVKVSERYRTTEQVERAFVDEREYTFLYQDGDGFHFMNPENYDQLVAPCRRTWSATAVYLQDGMPVTCRPTKASPIAMELPARVTLEIVETEPVVKGQTASGSYKPAILSNGLRTMVPTYITAGTLVPQHRRCRPRRWCAPARPSPKYMSGRRKLDVEFLDLVCSGSFSAAEIGPFAHIGQAPGQTYGRDRRRRYGRVQRHVVGGEAGADRGVHGVGHGEFAEQERPAEAASCSRQMAVIRSMSDWAPAQTLKPGWLAFRFIGRAARRLAKPECISPQMERQRARAARSLGSSPSLRQGLVQELGDRQGVPDLRCRRTVRQGVRNDGDSSSSSARAAASSSGTFTVSNSRPANLQSSQPRSDQEE